MNSLEPVVHSVAQFVVLQAGERNPLRRKMNPIGFEIPVPQTFVVAANWPARGVASVRAICIHTEPADGRARFIDRDGHRRRNESTRGLRR